MNIKTSTFSNDLGTIYINPITFAQLLRDSVDNYGGKIILSSPDGKVLGGIDRKVSLNEMVHNMSFYFNVEENIIEWKFYIILTFGESISVSINYLFDSLEKSLTSFFPGVKGNIEICVTGIKSKHIAYRNLSFQKEF